MSESAQIARPVARNLLALTGGRGAGLGLHFLAFMLLAAHLGPTGVGVYAFALALAALFRLVPAFGLEPIVVREIVRTPEREQHLVTTIAYLRLGLGAVTYGLLAATVALLGLDADTETASLIAGATLFFVWAETFRNSLSVRLRLGWAATAETVDGLVMVAGTVALIAADAGVLAFVSLFVAAKAINASIVLAAALRAARFAWRPHPHLLRGAVAAAAPIALAGLLISAYYRLDIVVLEQLKPLADVGQYGTGYRFYEAFLVLATLLSTILQPVLARSFTEGRAVLERRYGRAIRFVLVVALPLVVIGSMTAWRVLPAIPGLDEFEGAGVVLAILAPAIGFTYAASISQIVLIVAHAERRLLFVSAAALALNLVLIAALIPAFSYIGAAAATTATEAAVLLLSVREVRRRLELHPVVERVRPTAVAGAILVVLLVAGYAVHPFLQVGIGAAGYVAALLVTRSVSSAELRSLLLRRA